MNKPSRFIGSYPRIKDFRVRTKEKAVEYMGGRCRVCGYDKCSRALVFHHIDPSEKGFAISQNKNKAWYKVKTELDKCIMLCSNCHMELHDGLIDLPS